MKPALLLVVLSVLPAVAAGAAEVGHAHNYRACMILVQRDPEAAFDAAVSWRELGGGDAARHCLAAALMGMGQYAEAASRFAALAEDVKAEAAVKAELLGHAGQAWLMAGRPGRAYRALNTALELKPGATELLMDRSAALAGLGSYAEAVADLDRVVEAEPGRADAWVFRASAKRLNGDLDGAAADAGRALQLESLHPEGLLERGIIRRLQGDREGARQDWMLVINSAGGTAAAAAARANLEKMDVRIENE